MMSNASVATPTCRQGDVLAFVPEHAAGEPAAAASALHEYVQAARRQRPELDIGDEEFAHFVAERIRDGVLPPGRHAADLLLACGCTRGLAAALAIFHRDYGRVIDRVLAHRKAGEDVAADARQIVLAKLLVGNAHRGVLPKIADYRGAGALHSWVASAAATTLSMLRRTASRRREQPEEAEGAALGARLDPELDYLKLKYKAQVEEAIIAALGQLSHRDCTLLRLHLGERMSIDALGALYSVNRATSARWLAGARAALVLKTKAALQARLHLSAEECDSVLVLVKSQLEVSLVRRLSAAHV